MKTMWRAIACAAALATFAGGAAVAAERKEARKAPQRTETLACRLGTEDRHARIAVVLVGGKTDAFAYYSKWKPRTCSIYLQRQRDPYSKWADSGNITTVSIEKGAFLIEHKKNGEYHFIFRDVDRERYCGMDGVINGSLTIRKGTEQCVLDGDIMVEGTPLGEANVARAIQTPDPAQGTSDVQQAGLPVAAPADPNAATRAQTKPAAAPAAAVSSAPASTTTAAPTAATTAPSAPTTAPAAAATPATPNTSATTETTAPAAGTSTSTPAVSTPSAASETQPAAASPTSAAPKAQAAATGTSGSSANGADGPPASVSNTAAEKPAQPSGNPFSALFRSLSTTRND